MAARLPSLSKASPLGALRVVLPPSLTGEIVTLGTGVAPVPPPSAVAANSTTVKGALALLDHKLPAASKTSAQGAWIEPAPSSFKTSCGAMVCAPVRPANEAAAKPSIEVPALLATHRLPVIGENAMPSGPLKGTVEVKVRFGVTFPPAASWLGVNSTTSLAPLSATQKLPLLSKTPCWGNVIPG